VAEAVALAGEYGTAGSCAAAGVAIGGMGSVGWACLGGNCGAVLTAAILMRVAICAVSMWES
jgi:hypothetical protein